MTSKITLKKDEKLKRLFRLACMDTIVSIDQPDALCIGILDKSCTVTRDMETGFKLQTLYPNPQL
jgi:hypothetical protein